MFVRFFREIGCTTHFFTSQKLTPDQKQKYEKMAKDDKARSKATSEPCTAHNIPVSFIKNEQREMEKQELAMKKRIFRLVEDAVNANSKSKFRALCAKRTKHALFMLQNWADRHSFLFTLTIFAV
jgi:hypothetical protein